MTEKIRSNTLKQPIDNDDDIKEDPDTGLEIEREDPRIEKPFNPEEIRVRTENVTVQLLVSRIEHNEVELEPPFQRSFIWRAERQSRLIESLLLRIPIPVFYVAADENDNWLVVDGVQRISTIYNYVTDQFPLRQLEYLDKFDQKRYSELPRPMQRRIDETQLVVNVIDPRTPEDVMFNIFHRINTGGMTLNGQEIRNALHPGPVRDFLNRLANIQAFLQATDNSIKKDRMADQECVLRFIAFYVDAWEEYNDNDLNGYLSRAMTKINNYGSKNTARYLAEEFRESNGCCLSHFWQVCFSQAVRPTRYPVADRSAKRCLTRGVSSSQRCNASGNTIGSVEKREHIIDRFIALMNEDSDFDKAISYSTGTPQRVKKRFHAIAQLVTKELS